MELDCCNILAGSLYVLYDDGLAVDVEAELLELVGNLQAVYATVDDTSLAYLSTDGQFYSVQLLSKSFGFCLDLGELDSLLLEFLSENLLGTFAGNNALSLVAAIARLNVYYIVLVTESDYVFFQYNFHNLPPCFTSSNQLRKAAEPSGGHA